MPTESSVSPARHVGTGLTLYGIYAWIVAALVVLPWTIIIVLLPKVAWRRSAARKASRMLFASLGIRLEERDLVYVSSEEPSIVVANHASYLDGVILQATLPPNFAFVIKREVTSVPIMHLLLRRLGAEFVERFDRKISANDARRVLRKAGSRQALGFFPEGTFNPEPGLKPFRSGAFVAAARAGLPVIPVVIRGSREILPARSWFLRRGAIKVVALLPISPAGSNGEAVRSLSDAARRAMLTELDQPDLGSQ